MFAAADASSVTGGAFARLPPGPPPPLVMASTSGKDSVITVWDASTGAVVAALRGHSGAEPSSSSPHALAIVGSSHVAAAQAGRGGVHFWSWRGGGGGGKAGASAPPSSSSSSSSPSSSSPSGRSFPAEPALALASTRCGSLIAAGHASGSASLWDSQGRLLRCWPAHYKRTAALAFSGDGAWLLSGGGDGGVSLWDVADLCDSSGGDASTSSFSSNSSSSSAPFRAWPSAHTLPVTSVLAGAGRVGPLAASASLDHSVVLFAATAGVMVRRVQLGSPCRCLCLEGGEHCLYVGCEDGNIYEVDLVGGSSGDGGKRRRKGGDGGNSGGNDAALLPPGASAVLSGHAGAVTSLASPPSPGGSSSSSSLLLVSGSEDGTVRVWDAASRATLRLLRHAAAAAAAGAAAGAAATNNSSSSSSLPPVVAVVALPVGVGPRGALSSSAASCTAAAPHLGREERPAPWESGAVALTGLGAGGGPSVASSGLAGAGVAEASAFAAPASAAAAAAPAAAPSVGEEVEDASKLREQLAAAREEASRWKALHQRLLAETAADMA